MDSHILNHYYQDFPMMRPFFCGICRITCLGIEEFMEHFSLHYIACNICNEVLDSTDDLFFHTIAIHECAVKCSYCREEIQDANMFHQHLQEHNMKFPKKVVKTEEKIVPNNVNEYLCFICDHFFHDRAAFMIHFMKHENYAMLFQS